VLVLVPDVGCDKEGCEEEEDPEKACQNELPRRCTSVCEAIVARAACCGVGDGAAEPDADVEPSFGEEGGVGYADAVDVEAEAKEEGTAWCLPLRREERVGAAGLRMTGAEEK
jgi:hypothetical protein